ncbi:FTR1 family protein [Paenibacillus sp. GCM10023252]|uniref:FTR1 family iron permease n=1 Tax=Paenibacillus sp. GCM10023252 TaxID=3252649 RepID=UPI0036169C2C
MRLRQLRLPSRLLHTVFNRMAFIVLALGIGASCFTYPVAVSAAASADKDQNEQLQELLPLVGTALVEAGQSEWQQALKQIQQAAALWGQLSPENTDLTANVDSAIAAALKALKTPEDDTQAAKQSLSQLARAVNDYLKDQEVEQAGSLTGKEAAKSMVPTVQALLRHIEAGEWVKAKAEYNRMNSGWPKVERSVRKDNFTVYGIMETHMSMIRISLQAEPPRAEQAVSETEGLLEIIDRYASGEIKSQPVSDSLTVKDLVAVLDTALADLKAGHISEAEGQLQAFIAKWPAVEGQVSIRSAAAYTNIESQMTQAVSYLLESPPRAAKAEETASSMREQLLPLMEEKRYNAVDAGVILFREGLEAILVLAALLSYLKRTGHGEKRRWIWSGVWTGLLLSGVMAYVLTYFIAQAAAGSAREMIEGAAGLVSVGLMLTVGHWLHSKSNLAVWNRYIDQQMGKALARGSLWSLFAVAALAIMREGAETTIFYVGMAPSIDMWQLVLGFSVTFILLIGLGYFIIRFSAKLPIRPFFLTASALIYYLVIRFLGESIHSLQVARILPAHPSESLPQWTWIGAYPTWETTLPQLAVLSYVLYRLMKSLFTPSTSTEARLQR